MYERGDFELLKLISIAMKLLYLHQYFKFPDENGGTRSYDLSKGFIKLGYSVEVISTTSDQKYMGGKRWITIVRDGIKAHLLYLPYDNSFSFFKRKVIFAQFIFYASLKLLRLRGDVLIATSTPLTVGIPALIKRLVNRTPYIFEVRDVWPEAAIAVGAINSRLMKFALYRLESIIYRFASAVVPLSTDMRESILARHTFLNERTVIVVENISELERFANVENMRKPLISSKLKFSPRFCVLYAGTFGKVNGIEYVVKLAQRLVDIDPTIVFVLLGAGAEKNQIRDSAAAAGVLERNLFVLDPVAKEELPQYYFECDVGSSFVINSPVLWANSANKFFDSLAARRPVLINYGGWQAEKIKEFDVGFVLPPEIDWAKDEDLRKFVDYTRDTLRQTKQQEAAFMLAERSYSLRAAMARYEHVLEVALRLKRKFK